MNKHRNMASRYNGAKSRAKKKPTETAQAGTNQAGTTQNARSQMAEPRGSRPAQLSNQGHSAPISSRGLPHREPSLPHLPSGTNQISLRPPCDGVLYRLLIYCRVSKDDAYTGSHTLETQIARALEAADRKFGVDNYTYEIFTDDGLSGGYGHEVTGLQKKTRPTLKKIAEMLDTKTYDGFIIYDSSRFMRNTRVFNDFVEDHILANQITLVGASENIDVETSDGRFIATIIAAKNTKGRDDTIYRAQDATRRRAEKGYVIGNPPYGWRYQELRELDPNVRRGIAPAPEQVKVVKLMRDWYVSGWSTTRITGELNRLGMTTVTGRPWRQESIRKTLTSPVHSGQVIFAGKLYRGAHFEQRLWDPEDYEALVQVAASRKTWRPRSATEHVDVHLLEGFVFCHACSKRLYTIKAQKEYRAYRCINGSDKGQRTCPQMTVQAQAIEQQVIKEIAGLAELPEMRALLEQEATHIADKQDVTLAAQKVQLEKALASTNGQISRWVGLFNEGEIAKDQFLPHNAALLSKRAQQAQSLHTVESQLAARSGRVKLAQSIKATVLDFAECWKHLNMDERRQMLSLVLESLSVSRVGRDITLHLKVHFLPAREVLLMIKMGYKRKPEGVGPHTVTARQLAFLHHINQGKSTKEAGAVMGLVDNTTRFMMTDIRKRMGMHDITECAAQCRSRIGSLLHSLSLGPLRPRSADGTICLSEKLMAVFPMLANGAKLEKVGLALGLPTSTVANRKQEIVKRMGAEDIFEAGEKARAMGLLR